MIESTPLPDGGQHLIHLQAARIPGAIGHRSKTPFKLPLYRITT